MFVVRNRFVAKPGCAGKLAAQLKEAVRAFEMPNARVLTDVTGDFNQVVMEFTADNLGELEKRMQETMGSPKYREKRDIRNCGSPEAARFFASLDPTCRSYLSSEGSQQGLWKDR